MPPLTGAYRTAKRLVDRLPAWVLRARPMRLYSADLADRPAEWETPPRSAGESTGWVDAEGLQALGNLAAAENLAEWDGESRRVMATTIDDRPVGCAWIATGGEYVERALGLQYGFGPSDAWLYAASVLPERRRQGVYGRLLGRLSAELRSEGVERVLFGVAVGNEASLRAHAALRPEPLGGLIAVRCLGVGCCLARGRIDGPRFPPVAIRSPLTIHLSGREGD